MPGSGDIFTLDNGFVRLHTAHDVVGLHRQDFLQCVRACAVRLERPNLHLPETLAAELGFTAQRLLCYQGVKGPVERAWILLRLPDGAASGIMHVSDRYRAVEILSGTAVAVPLTFTVPADAARPSRVLCDLR